MDRPLFKLFFLCIQRFLQKSQMLLISWNFLGRTKKTRGNNNNWVDKHILFCRQFCFTKQNSVLRKKETFSGQKPCNFWTNNKHWPSNCSWKFLWREKKKKKDEEKMLMPSNISVGVLYLSFTSFASYLTSLLNFVIFYPENSKTAFVLQKVMTFVNFYRQTRQEKEKEHQYMSLNLFHSCPEVMFYPVWFSFLTGNHFYRPTTNQEKGSLSHVKSHVRDI